MLILRQTESTLSHQVTLVAIPISLNTSSHRHESNLNELKIWNGCGTFEMENCTTQVTWWRTQSINLSCTENCDQRFGLWSPITTPKLITVTPMLAVHFRAYVHLPIGDNIDESSDVKSRSAAGRSVKAVWPQIVESSVPTTDGHRPKLWHTNVPL